MHIHLPKPVHGWREFFGEVGIIVIGVLIALGAEQVVETLHWRHEVSEFREALDRELALNLGTSELNQLQKPCVDRRLDELRKVLDQVRAGAPVRLTGRIAGPVTWSQYRGIWENKNPQVMAHLPMSVRLKYGEVYDELRNTETLKLLQAEIWSNLVPFEEAGPLSLTERRELYALIMKAQAVSGTMASNWPISLKLGQALGVRPAYPSDVRDVRADIAAFSICKPLLPSGAHS